MQQTLATSNAARCQKDFREPGFAVEQDWVGCHWFVLLDLVSECVFWNSGAFTLIAIYLLKIGSIRELDYSDFSSLKKFAPKVNLELTKLICPAQA